MLYFEDFMEDIEDLPYEFKENLTAIRQLDLQVQNIMDPLDGRINDFFQKCSQNLYTPSQSDQEYEKILKEFEEVDAKNVEKIAISNQMKETFNKMMKKLDTELGKFKLELEADNPGSAEAIERMVQQQIKAGVSDGVQRFDRKRIKRGRLPFDFSNRPQLGPRKMARSGDQSETTACLKAEKTEPYGGGPGHQSDALMTTAVANGSLSPASSFMGSLNTPHSIKRRFDWKNTGSTSAIDKAVKLERRHKVMSALSDDSGSNMGTADDLGGMDEPGPAPPPPLLFEHHQMPSHGNSGGNSGGCQGDMGQEGRGGSEGGRTPASLSFGLSYEAVAPDNCLIAPPSDRDCGFPLSTAATTGGHDNPGNEEPRYCFCNDVSYGDMIACDSASCPREWFHYGCVNLAVAPKGSWFCRECKGASARSRQRR